MTVSSANSVADAAPAASPPPARVPTGWIVLIVCLAALAAIFALGTFLLVQAERRGLDDRAVAIAGRESEVAALEMRRTTIVDEITGLERRIAELGRAEQAARDEMDAAERAAQDAASRKAERDAAVREREQAIAERDGARKELDEIRSRMAADRKELAEITADRDSLMKERAALKAEIETLKKEHKEASDRANSELEKAKIIASDISRIQK